MDFARARNAMVEGQVRTADVTDPAVLQALRTLPRERFAPAHLRSLAYADLELEAAPGRVLMRPRDLAKLLQALAVRPGERALEIAGATGYGAAALAQCGAKPVFSLDPDAQFYAAAPFAAVGVGDATAVTGPVAAGWKAGAPYDVILVNGAVEFIPDAWGQQLADGGRLGVVVRNGAAGEARIYTRTKDALAHRAVFDAAPPIAPGMERPRAFAF